MRALFTFILTVLFSTISFAKDCSSLKEDLASMAVAQKVVTESLVSNHAVFASTLEEFASHVDEGELSFSSKAALPMKRAAKTFRERGEKGQRTVQQLNAMTEELHRKVALCLTEK